MDGRVIHGRLRPDDAWRTCRDRGRGHRIGFAGASRVQPVAGLALILALAYCLSSARRRSTTAPWRGVSGCSFCSR